MPTNAPSSTARELTTVESSQPGLGEASNEQVLSEADLRDLEEAVRLLENPSFGARAADIVGMPIEKSLALLPDKGRDAIASAAQKAIGAALRLALKSMDTSGKPGDGNVDASDWWHLGATAVTGAVGGAFGLGALAAELPITTCIMLRSIADVARSQGADLTDPKVQIECVQTFALGGRAGNDDNAELGYFIARETMTKAVSDTAAHIVKNGLQKEGAPALARLIIVIAERYSIQVGQKAAAQLVPIIGGVGGALINTVFMDHFQNVARGHFIVRRLETTHGAALVEEKYRELHEAQRRAR